MASVTYLRVRNGEILSEITMDTIKDVCVLPAFDGINCEELIRKDRMETTLKAALSLATAAEVYSKVGLVDKRAVEVKPIVIVKEA